MLNYKRITNIRVFISTSGLYFTKLIANMEITPSVKWSLTNHEMIKTMKNYNAITSKSGCGHLQEVIAQWRFDFIWIVNFLFIHISLSCLDISSPSLHGS